VLGINRLNLHSHISSRSVILAFCRNYLIDDFRASAAPILDDHEFHFLTDGVCPGTPDTREAFYGALRAGTLSTELTDADEADVIARCRMLRRLDRETGRRLVHAMAIALGEALDRIRPDVVLSQMVDEYVTHTLSLLAAKRRIGYVGFCAGYFPGRSLLLADAYGSPFNWRDADDVEVDETLEQILPQSFRQNYNLSPDYSWPKHVYQLVRYQVKRLGFAIRGRLERDPWNIHYAVTPYLAERRHLRDYPKASYFHADWKERLAAEKMRRPDAPVVYLPLGFFPESTIDYWISNKRVIAYEPLILGIVRALARDCIVVVKEHLHMMGIRDGRFLATLKSITGAINIHPKEVSNLIVDQVDAVLLGSGSPGIEATIRGKPVFSFCDTSYWFAPSGATWLDLDRIEVWPATIAGRLADFVAADAREQRKFIRACLQSSTRLSGKGRFWPIVRPDDLKAVLATARLRTDAPAERASS
jgi:hypothetical protein